MVINHAKMGDGGWVAEGEVREGSGTQREGQGLEEERRRRVDGKWTAGVGKVGRTTQISSRPRPRSLALRDAAHPVPRMAVERCPFLMPASHVEPPRVRSQSGVARGRGLDEQGDIASYRKPENKSSSAHADE